MTTQPSLHHAATHLLAQAQDSTLPLHVIRASEYKTRLPKLSSHARRWLESTHFKATAGQFSLLPGKEGALSGVLACVADTPDLWAIAHLPAALPEGHYALAAHTPPALAESLALGWLLGCYQFTAYKKSSRGFAKLVAPEGVDIQRVQTLASALCLARDLINTPANDMHPEALAQAAAVVAEKTKAKIRVITGEALLQENYPTIYAVGKASSIPPRLVDMRWGRADAPKVTLVGKGVCFDTGGLDIKSSSNMKLMKKDMGGAAVCLALAQAIISRGLDMHLRVLLPVVENAVAGNAMRPTDIIRTRKGITVEIGNTDAEGRLILCDALYEADTEKPELLIDCATLTGAARVALGPEVPAFFTPDDALANELARHAAAQHDPLYRLPLWGNYRDMLDSKVADISNDPESAHGGAITAALYLKEFVTHTSAWVHIDMMAWNPGSKPGRPAGGEAQGLRALLSLLEERYGRH